MRSRSDTSCNCSTSRRARANASEADAWMREGLQQVDVVRLERLALARLRDQEHREHVALGVEREEERRAQPDVRIHPKRTWVGPEITDELCTSRARATLMTTESRRVPRSP